MKLQVVMVVAVCVGALAACGDGGPSESELEAMLQKQRETNTRMMFGSPMGSGRQMRDSYNQMVGEIIDFEKEDCEFGEELNGYACEVSFRMKGGMLDGGKQAGVMIVKKYDGEGWRLLSVR